MKRDIIHECENQIAWYFDILKETSDGITYAELITPHKGKAICAMEYEEYVDIAKDKLKDLTYEQILLYLKNIEPDKEKGISKLDKFKVFLKNKDIAFESDLFTWHNEDLN
jgi:hypothetical protein